MFASTSLAARVERAECRLLADSVAAAESRHPETGVFATPLAGGIATYVMPGAPLNKVAGLGFSPLEELPAWLDVVVTGFASPDAQGVPSGESYPRDLLESVMADMASAEGFSRYLARRDGDPAGGAALRLCEGVAHLCGAATLPAHRRRGVQSALLAERLDVAARAGCDVAVVITEPGSRSQENVQRHGFEVLYARAILVRERAG